MSKPPKIKLTLPDRKRALNLLAEGHTVESASRHLHNRYHSELPFSHVVSSYFTNAGPFSMASMQGKSRKQIAARYVEMQATAEQWKKRAKATLAKSKQDPAFRKTWIGEAKRRILVQLSDPAFREASAKGSRKSLVQLRQDPVWVAKQAAAVKVVLARLEKDATFRANRSAAARKNMLELVRLRPLHPEWIKKQKAAASATFRRLNVDPVFLALKSTATKARWVEYRRRKAIHLLDMVEHTGWETATGGKEKRQNRVPVYVPNLEEAIDAARQLRRMLGTLPARQRVLLANFFEIEMKHSEQALQEARELQPLEIREELDAAFEKLKQHPLLKELIEE